MANGIDFTSIIDNSFYMRTYSQTKALGVALNNSFLMLGDKMIASWLDESEMKKCGVLNNQLGGIVEQLRLTSLVEVAAFIYQVGENEYKVSLRSKNTVDVSAIAIKHHGGGHVRAAGFNMSGSKEEIFKILEQEIAEQL